MSATISLGGMHCFHTERQQKTKQQSLHKAEDEKPGRRYCCAVCAAYVTDDRYITSMNQQHCHTRSNPDNQSFSFGCFSTAPGARADGPATDEHSWFAGYRWRFVHCRNCGVQLGWQFTGERDFYALILEQLVDCGE